VFYVSILQCADDSYYVGFTEFLEARIHEHKNGTLGACHTFLRRPVTLAYTESYVNQVEAIKRERQLKNWSHAKKTALITGDLAALKALSKRRKP
jgi:putative endonuclease